MAAIAKARRLHRVREKLKRELADLELAGLDEKAESVREEIRQVGEKIETIKQDHRRQERERRRREREAQERHDASRKEMEEAAARRRKAREWLRSYLRFSHGRPQPADQVLEMAEQAGHDPDVLASAVTRLKRRSDGRLCLGFQGEGYLRRDFLPVEDLTSAVGGRP